MSSRLLATLVVIGLLFALGVAACTYSELRERWLLRVADGSTESQIRAKLGEPESVHMGPGRNWFGCSDSRVVKIYTYRVFRSRFVDFGFDAAGKVVCKLAYNIYIWANLSSREKPAPRSV
jgi:hypothetical protein